MTLLSQIASRIAAHGPMRIDEYMTTCLLHPTLGYYTTRDPLGRDGDFVTSPEISQMFGELIGLSLAQTWLQNGAPPSFILAELGPGRGTLMADALRACRGVPRFIEAANVILIEASDVLRGAQADALRGYNVKWFDRIEDMPPQPLYLIANEFFDALPIRQFQRSGAQWQERQVGLDEGTLVFGLAPPAPQPTLADRLNKTPDGTLVEICAAASPIAESIGQHIEQYGGAALIIDYGNAPLSGNTLQAVKSHETVSPLETPGQADLTAHVDFAALAEAAPCASSSLIPQGVFLERLGITARAQSLAQALAGDALQSHIAAHRRLTHPEEMGNLFKVLALFKRDSTPPPGVET
ncbi:ATP synthase beta subunit/transription termination factor rho [Sulfitobacter noctilucicola]|uniref:SAM-dependent MidA family methyltransferase n=1 Tax=Sulfitobacter noctilucicola TaxID=1342301 RepID=A0A7W6Q550_9RHOB|nr:SAM-dependent methyltransferase [Sulfitobacter noctilucicola]KIN62013.1 ATP synthase beta subunit/transription termination factor rho [Sulfitobacter noctilucicola]MBB4173467.1 SAM-dependent MidA family methyltransferase [Sulfitobacter noctilucicola]